MGKVNITEQKITIPTYGVGEAEKNPMFLEKRVYQASKGNVYPYPFIEKVEDIKFDKEYTAIIIENDYISLTMLPELGGRIQYGYDKLNDYDFFYRNQVIKPALVGLAGPWISGGVEFNWPQHHRPSTFSPVEYKIIENNDGSKTLWMSEIEMMSRMVGKVGITVYPDKAYVEVKGSSYNYSNIPQNFLWWANIAVHVHDKYESFFPQDVKYVADHGKREVTSYPYADKVYYNVDYPTLDKDCRNITNYKNIPVPMSYMAMGSDYDFFGGYDFREDKGTIYVSNHHVAPGKKQWTWGCGDFGQAWDRQLTDVDGPYAELMAGAYTDNQPDFTWINPFEEKEFNQFWYPYKKLGKVKNANLNAAVNLEYKSGVIEYRIGTPVHLNNCVYEIYINNDVLISKEFTLSPADDIILGRMNYELENFEGLGIRILSSNNEKLIDFCFTKDGSYIKAKPAVKALRPEEIKTNDELYQIGTHLEQYRHATYYPDDYYLEALRRDPNDIRCNSAYGMLLLKRHNYDECVAYFEEAINSATKYNPNPKDCEAYYGLGLAKYLQKEYKSAYDNFYKSIWDFKYRSSGYFKLAQIDCINGDYQKALDHVELSLATNVKNIKARNLKMLILGRLNDTQEVIKYGKETIKDNPFAYLTVYELDLINETNLLHEMLEYAEKTYIELAIEYSEAGEYKKANHLLKDLVDNRNVVSPMIYYFIGYFHKQLGEINKSDKYYELGRCANPDYCFPHRVEEKIVLLDVLVSKNDGQAAYLVGNLLYDKLSFKEAIEYFEKSLLYGYHKAIVYRNLGIAYFNINKDVKSSLDMYEMAHKIDNEDGRILYELDQLFKILNKPVTKRLEFLNERLSIVESRDDLYLEYVTIHNELGMFEKALELLLDRNFHPFEGGEGKVSDQYKFANIEIGKKLLIQNNPNKAIKYFKDAKVFPHNLGEGKIYGTPEADINYYLGMCYSKIGNVKTANEYFKQSAEEKVESSSNLSYKPEKLQMHYYQALSMRELGLDSDAKTLLENLVDYATKKSDINAEIDYFAISVPEFLIFEVDLNLINKTHCYYLTGLGYLGLDNLNKAKEFFEKALELNLNNYEAQAMYNLKFSK